MYSRIYSPNRKVLENDDDLKIVTLAANTYTALVMCRFCPMYFRANNSLNLHDDYKDGYHYYLYFTDKETEACLQCGGSRT